MLVTILFFTATANVAQDEYHQTRLFNPKVVQATDYAIREGCGVNCVTMYHEMLNWVSTNANGITKGKTMNESQILEKQLTSLMEREVDKITEIRDKLIPKATSFLQTHARSLLPSLLSAVPCSSQTACNAMEKLGNACNYARLGAQFIYSAVNKVVFVLGAVINILCGCLHINSFSRCFLQFVPMFCQFPYNVYSKLYSISQSLWETVKSTTKKCGVHGSPMLLIR